MVPSGDQAGEMIGSFERSATCVPSPSASATQRNLRAFAIGVGHFQPVLAAGLGDVSNAGGEGAARTDQFFIDVVGDLVGGNPCHLWRGGLCQGRQLRCLDGVEQAIAHVEAAVGQALHAADHQRIGAARLPVAVIDRRGLRHRAAGVDYLEEAAAQQIGLDDGADLLRRDRFIGEGGNGNRNLVGADAGNLDAQLRLRGTAGDDGKRGDRELDGATCADQVKQGFLHGLLVLRFVRHGEAGRYLA